MGEAFINRRSGMSLNYKVVRFDPGAVLPESASKNTIAIFTEVELAGNIFSPTEPTEPTQGMLWIKTGTSSPVAFDALKKGGILIYPLCAFQYIDGAWVSVTAKSYQDGEWVDWVTFLFNEGDTCDDITGGWSNSGYTYTGTVGGASTSYTKVAPTVGNTIKVSVGAELKVAIAGTENKIDLTDTNTVALDVESVVGQAFAIVTKSKALGSDYAVIKALTASSAGTTVNLDVSSLSGSYYIAVFTYGSTNITTRSAEVAKVWYE